MYVRNNDQMSWSRTEQIPGALMFIQLPSRLSSITKVLINEPKTEEVSDLLSSPSKSFFQKQNSPQLDTNKFLAQYFPIYITFCFN